MRVFMHHDAGVLFALFLLANASLAALFVGHTFLPEALFLSSATKSMCSLCFAKSGLQHIIFLLSHLLFRRVSMQFFPSFFSLCLWWRSTDSFHSHFCSYFYANIFRTCAVEDPKVLLVYWPFFPDHCESGIQRNCFSLFSWLRALPASKSKVATTTSWCALSSPMVVLALTFLSKKFMTNVSRMI